jgi:hypothetical protein
MFIASCPHGSVTWHGRQGAQFDSRGQHCTVLVVQARWLRDERNVRQIVVCAAFGYNMDAYRRGGVTCSENKEVLLLNTGVTMVSLAFMLNDWSLLFSAPPAPDTLEGLARLITGLA